MSLTPSHVEPSKPLTYRKNTYKIMKRKTTATKHLNLKHLAAALPFLTALKSFAATTYMSAVSAGNWSSSSSWTVTGTGSPVYYQIQTGHNITLDANVTGIDTLYIHGTLTVNSNVYLRMNATGAIFFNSTGILYGGSNNTEIQYGTSTSVKIIGPFTSARQIDNGPRYGDINTMIAANGDPQGSFPVPLPLPFKNAELSDNGNELSLSWVALGDENKKNFLVALSQDGIRYEPYATLTGTANPGESRYIQNIPRNTPAAYVRVSAYSGADTSELFVKPVPSKSIRQSGFTFRPSEAGLNDEIEMSFPEAGVYTLTVYDLAMKEISSSGFTTDQNDQKHHILAAQLAPIPGVYIAVISGVTSNYRQKFMIH